MKVGKFNLNTISEYSEFSKNTARRQRELFEARQESLINREDVFLKTTEEFNLQKSSLKVEDYAWCESAISSIQEALCRDTDALVEDLEKFRSIESQIFELFLSHTLKKIVSKYGLDQILGYDDLGIIESVDVIDYTEQTLKQFDIDFLKTRSIFQGYSLRLTLRPNP